MASQSNLAQLSLSFAEQVQSLLRATLPGNTIIEPTEAGSYFSIRPIGKDASERAIPLHMKGEPLARLSLRFHQELDRTGRFLKTSESVFTV